jgi:uncharacterized delta-60 repeat protein
MSTIRVDKIMPFQSSSVEILGSFNGTYTGSFTGSFVGDGSGLTGIPGSTPMDSSSFASTGSNIFIGNQTITGSIFMSGSQFSAKVSWPVQDSEYDLIEPEPFTIEELASGSRTYGYNAFGLEHYNDDLYDSYHNSFNFYFFSSSNFGDVKNYGSEFNLGPMHSFLRMYPSGANITINENVGNISLNDLQDGRTRANIYGNEIQLGAFRGDVLLIGNTGSLVIVKGTTRHTGSIDVDGSVTASVFSGSFVGDGSGLTGIAGSINTGSFATTGSNTFVGNQIVSGSVDVSGSINSDGYELEGSSTTNIPALNSTFNLDLSGSGDFGGINFINKSLVLGDGKVLVAGRFQSIDGHTTNDIARLNSNGTVDTSFTAPIFGYEFGGDYYGFINTFVTQSDNKILVGGNFTEIDGNAREGIARLNADGTLDTSFVTQSWGTFSEVRDIVIQNDGKIVCVGYFTSGSRRINTDGTLDTSFNVSTGSNQPEFFNNDYFHSVALLTSGSGQAILIGGNFQQWGSFSDYNYLVKLNPNGSLDFGFAGTNLDMASTSNGFDRIQKIKVSDDGYIYVAGRFRDTLTGPNVRNAGFARLTTTDEGNGIGAFDSGFRTYITGSDQNNPGTQYVNDFDFYDGDKILLGGSFTTIGIPGYTLQSANRFVIVRQSTGGQVSNWSSDGLASKYNLNNNFNTATVNSVTLLSGDNVLVGGTFTSASFPSTAREGLASFKLTGFGDVTTTSEYTITADSTRLLVSSSNTRFSGDVNIIGSVTASEFSGSFVGDGSGLTGIAGSINTGSFATTGSNSFVGNQVISGSITISGSISQNGIGEGNTFMGAGAGTSNNRTLGIYNTFIGVAAGAANTNGQGNLAIGPDALNNNIYGDFNIAIGSEAGRYAGGGGTTNTTSNNSIFIGHSSYAKSNNQTNQIVIGHGVEGNGSNTTTIGNSNTTATYLKGKLILSGSVAQEITGSLRVTSAVTASSFTGSFIGDGSGLTGITSTLPSDILSSSVTNFTDYSQSVDTRISSIVTGTGFATTGSNTFVGNQVITGSLTLSSSAAVELRVVGNSVLTGSLDVTGSLTISTGSITVPGSGSLVNFVANPSTMRSIRGNGAGLFNIVEQSDGNMTFTVSKIGTRDLTGAITSNISGSTINGSFSDNTTTTSGQGRGARLRGVISGGTVVSLQIETSPSSFGYEEEGQPANRQGIGYKAGDTVTIAQSLNQTSGSLTITLRPQDIDTYFGVHNNFSFDYKDYSRLTVGGGIVTSGSITVGATANTLGGIMGNSIAAGDGVDVTSDYSIAVGRDLYNDYITGYANATFGLHHSSSNYAQTIVGIASRLDDTGEGAFVVGNGTSNIGGGTLTRSNLLVAQGNKVEISGSLQMSGSIIPNVPAGQTTSSFSLGSPTAAWKDIWVSDGTINFVNGAGVQQGTLSSTANGLQLSGDLFLGNFLRVGNGPGSGSSNTVVGAGALQDNVTGNSNTAMGSSALGNNSVGNSNTAFGSSTLAFSTSGSNNTAIGEGAMYFNGTGGFNTAVGRRSLYQNRIGGSNTSIGYQSLFNSASGSGNTAIGYQAGRYASGSSGLNVYIGYEAGSTSNIEETGKLYIDIQANDTPLIGGDFIGREVSIDGQLNVGGNLTASTAILAQVSSSYNFADDTAAASGGVPLGGLYHTSGSVKIRLV